MQPPCELPPHKIGRKARTTSSGPHLADLTPYDWWLIIARAVILGASALFYVAALLGAAVGHAP